MRLRFAWWNTGLTGKSPSKTQISIAAKVIRALMHQEGCGLVGLCEVRPSMLQPLMQEVLRGTTWRSHAAHRDPQRSHDLVLLFDPNVVTVTTGEPVLADVADHRIFAGLVFDLGLPKEQFLKLALCHWPAELGNQDHARKLRNASAFQMHGALRRSSEGTLHDAIVLGDFNAEPFSEAMDTMGGTRDIEQARKRKGLLYNAGWRWLGSLRPFDGRTLSNSPAGTYLMRTGGRESAWRTFDQVLVSRAVLVGVGWTLREDETTPWYGDELKGPRGALPP